MVDAATVAAATQQVQRKAVNVAAIAQRHLVDFLFGCGLRD
jgi:hypothetical protein